MIAAAWLFGVGGAILVGIGGFFLLARPALLPEDLRYLRRTTGEIDAALPSLREWLRLVFIVLGGYAVATGTLTIYLAATDIRNAESSAVAVLAVAGASSIGVMALVNFALHSTFRWLLSAAAALWIVATLVAVLS
ncbi:hypothetical protein KUF57_12795 [Mycolicibacterium sp. PAM1]|uniref:hypothetical protein n=1 Tax=Mycolicibacterium sp. PAM1 TaxID=2853535 RepID=UPI001C3C8F99|nr:hypothetical protein [Mycolicibacterium sp. PAM1]MBV5244413.1 hypothetical protein [Mycolicibacterium sp. PAM1]